MIITSAEIEELAREYVDQHDRWNRDQSESERLRYRLFLGGFLIYLNKHKGESNGQETQRRSKGNKPIF